MREDRLTRVILARTNQDRGDESGGAGVDVDDGTTGIVEDAEATEPSAAPDPMGYWRVDDERPEGDEDEIGTESLSLDDRPRDEGGRNDRERSLVRHE
jgi:hypothetical protein